MDKAPEIRETLRSQGRSLRDEIPEVFRAFADLSRASMRDGDLPALTKEFSALAISIVKE